MGGASKRRREGRFRKKRALKGGSFACSLTLHTHSLSGLSFLISLAPALACLPVSHTTFQTWPLPLFRWMYDNGVLSTLGVDPGVLHLSYEDDEEAGRQKRGENKEPEEGPLR
jgi:hypothetical protein